MQEFEMSIVLTKQRRGSLNNIINREINKRERIQIEKKETELGTRTVCIAINPVYLEWTEDKKRGQWIPQNFDRNIANAGFDDCAFAVGFVNAMDALYSEMCAFTRITKLEYEETYGRVFAASYNIERYYMNWEERFFGLTQRVYEWKNR